MKQLGNTLEQQIMPPELFEHYVNARTNTYASGKEPVLGLNGLNNKDYYGYRYPEEPKEDDHFVYEDNFRNIEGRPGNFVGYELNRDASGKVRTHYGYEGRLTDDGLKLGENAVDSILKRFLRENITEVRFGKKVRFVIEDGQDTWVYEGNGKIEDRGLERWVWTDEARIKLNGNLVYELGGIGAYYP